METVTDAEAGTRRYACNAAGRLVETVDALGRVVARFSAHNDEGREFHCLAPTHTIFAWRLAFTLGPSGPVRAKHVCEPEFGRILASVTIC